MTTHYAQIKVLKISSTPERTTVLSSHCQERWITVQCQRADGHGNETNRTLLGVVVVWILQRGGAGWGRNRGSYTHTHTHRWTWLLEHTCQKHRHTLGQSSPGFCRAEQAVSQQSPYGPVLKSEQGVGEGEGRNTWAERMEEKSWRTRENWGRWGENCRKEEKSDKQNGKGWAKSKEFPAWGSFYGGGGHKCKQW